MIKVNICGHPTIRISYFYIPNQNHKIFAPEIHVCYESKPTFSCFFFFCLFKIEINSKNLIFL